MAIARAQTKVTASSASATSLTLTLGSTPTVGNLMTIGCSDGGANTPSPPSGWSTVSTTAGQGTIGKIFYRVVNSGDGKSYSVTQGTASALAAMIDEWTGFTSTPVLLDYGSNDSASAVSSLSMSGASQAWAHGGSSDAQSDLVYVTVAPGGSNATSFVASGGLTQDTTVTANLDILIATPTSATSFASAGASWTNAHAVDLEAAIFSSQVAGISVASGFPVQAQNTNSLSVTTQNVGDVVIVGVAGVAPPSALSARNITFDPAPLIATSGSCLWRGIVTTTGTDTITATFASGTAYEIFAYEFTSTLVPNCTWSLVATGGPTHGSTNAITFASVTADNVHPQQLYIGIATVATNFVVGSTTGFTYLHLNGGDGVAFNTGLTLGATYAPTASQTSTGSSYDTIGVIISASAGAGGVAISTAQPPPELILGQFGIPYPTPLTVPASLVILQGSAAGISPTVAYAAGASVFQQQGSAVAASSSLATATGALVVPVIVVPPAVVTTVYGPPVSSSFIPALSASHRIAVQATVSPRTANATNLTVVSGKVYADLTTAFRRRCQFVVEDPTGTITPPDLGGLLAPNGNEVQLWRGITYASGNIELISLGIFGISEVDVEDDGEQFLLTVYGYDRSRTVSRLAWTDVYTVPAGITYDVAIRNLIESRFPNGSGYTYNFTPVAAVTPSSPLLTFANQGSNNDPWAAATTLATAAGCFLYFDVLGNLVLTPAASGVNQQPLMTYGTAAGVVKAKRLLINEGVYNDVIVIASGTAVGTPVRGRAQDTNTGSPTNVSGPYGDIPQVVSTSTVTSQVAATVTAQAMLLTAAGLSDTVQMDVIPNAALDIGTVVTLSRARMNMSGNYVITYIETPLESGTAQTLHLRRQQPTS